VVQCPLDPTDTNYSSSSSAYVELNPEQPTAMSQCHRFQKATSRRFTRLREEERGQSMVEFAIVLPVLLLFVLGILYFGRFEDYANQSTQLAEEGARWAAVNFDAPGTGTSQLQLYVQGQAQPELQAGSSDVTSPARVFIYYPTGSSNVVGNTVRACVTFAMTFPVATKLVGPQTVTQTATMRIEQAAPLPLNWTADSTNTAAAAGCSISP
jgi:Flp pilus assembly protein TadG